MSLHGQPVTDKDLESKAHEGSFDEHQVQQEHLDSEYLKLTRWQTIKTFWKPILFCTLMAVSALNDGYAYNLPGNVITNRGFINQFGTEIDPATGLKKLSSHIVSVWGGVTSAFSVIGQYAASPCMDYAGRKIAMYTFLLFLLLGLILQIVARDWKVWLASKCLMGIGVGMVQVTATTYINEIAPSQIRGALLANYSLFFGLGQLAAAIALQIVATSTPLKYLNSIYSQFVLFGLSLITVAMCPESPYYYARKHKSEQGKKSLNRINGYIAGFNLEREYAVIENEIRRQEELQKGVSVLEIFKGSNLRRTLAASLAIGSQPLMGTAVFFTYTTYFFEAAGLDDAFLANLIIFVILNVFIFVSFFTTEKFGRRPLLVYGCIVMGVLNVCLGVTGSVKTTSASKNAGLAMTCLWIAVYALTAAPLGFVVASEISTPRLKTLTTSFSFAIYGIINLIFGFAVPYFVGGGVQWNTKSGYLFGGLAFVVALGLFFILPETAGRSFPELDELFERGIPARQFRKTLTTVEQTGQKKHQA